MNKYILILPVLILGCGAKSNDKITEDVVVDSLERTSALIAAADNEPEDFNEFFEKIKTDSLFQIQRVKFPWRFLIQDEDKLKVFEETKMEDWRHFSFHYADSFATRRVDAYTQELKNYGDTVKLELRGVDNGIYTNYLFVKEDGKWYFVSCEDYSN